MQLLGAHTSYYQFLTLISPTLYRKWAMSSINFLILHVHVSIGILYRHIIWETYIRSFRAVGTYYRSVGSMYYIYICVKIPDLGDPTQTGGHWDLSSGWIQKPLCEFLFHRCPLFPLPMLSPLLCPARVQTADLGGPTNHQAPTPQPLRNSHPV